MSAEARAARERKQKIFVAVGGVLLLALLAFQLPKLLGGSESTAAPAATTTATVGAPATTTPTGELVPPADDAVPVSVTLVDTDRRLTPAPGQLRSFETFSRKDPFVQQIKDSSAGTAEGAGGTGGAPGGGKAPETPAKGFTVGTSTAAVAVTVISVNGTRQPLTPGVAFPAADPVFVLIAEQPEAKTVVIGVAGGAYANGANTTKLKVGKPIVLVNTTTGARYRVVLVAVGNGGTTSPAGPGRDEGQATTP